MNNTRRRKIKNIMDRMEELRQLLSDISSDLEEVKDEEEEARDNIPESLWETEKYQKADEAVDALENAMSYLEDMDSSVGEVEGYLEGATA